MKTIVVNNNQCFGLECQILPQEVLFFKQDSKEWVKGMITWDYIERRWVLIECLG